MIKEEVDTLVVYYNRFVEIVKQLSLAAEEQIEKLRGTSVADEIATDYCEIALTYAKKLLENQWITNEQYKLIKEIEEKFNIMTQNKTLWSDDALLTAKEWNECRAAGKRLLLTL